MGCGCKKKRQPNYRETDLFAAYTLIQSGNVLTDRDRRNLLTLHNQIFVDEPLKNHQSDETMDAVIPKITEYYEQKRGTKIKR